MSKNTQTSGLTNYLTHSGNIVSVSGSLTVTGSLNATAGITGSFQGVATTASYVLNAVSASFATSASYAVSASITTNAVTASYALNAVSASFATSAANATTSSYALNATTASHALNAVSSSFATTAVTSSFANAFTVAGTLTATTLVVQTITSSVDFVTGSTRFGSLLANTHAFTGSVGITGSLTLNNIAIPTSASLASNYLPLTGGTLTGALGGTSATFSGAINSSASAVFNGTGRGISYQYCDMTNTSGRLILGLEGSTAGNAFPNSEAYSVNIGTDQNQAFGVFTNNLRRLTIASTGAATFSSNITAKGPSNDSFIFQGLSSANITIAGFYQNSTAGGWMALYNSAASQTVQIASNSTSYLNGGNVGIGTTSPVSLLTVATGNVTNAGQWTSSAIALYNPTNIGAYSQISFGYTVSTTNASAYIGYVSTNQNSNGFGDLVFGTRNVSTDTQPTERMRITGGGNVGIGTNSPSAISTYTTLDVRGATGAAIRMGRTGSATPFNLQHDGTDAYLNNVANGALYFYTNDTARMTISGSNGNVGIGTTSPAYTLDVNGIIGAKNIIRLNASSTTSVSTSATTISTGSNTYGGLAIVWGNDASGNIWTDLLFYSLGQVYVIRSQDVSGGPFGRTYTVNGSGSLLLTMGGGTYTVRYQALLTT